MNPDNLIKSIQNSLSKLRESNLNLDEKVRELDQIIRQVIAILSEKENLYFSSYYAKASFLFTKYKISSKDQFLFHRFRKLANAKKNIGEDHLNLGYFVLNVISENILDTQILEDFSSSDVTQFFTYQKKDENQQFIPYLKVYLHDFDTEKNAFLIQNEEEQKWWMSLDEENDNKQLLLQLEKLKKLERLPTKLAIFDIKSYANNLTASYYVLEPDYLVDVTSISEAFDAFGVSVAGYSLKKMIDKGGSLSLHVGNLANVILDELIYDPSISFNHFKNNIFQISPLSFATLTNDQVRQLVDAVLKHYTNIKKVVYEDFQNQNITGKSVYVEPSFYAPRIGVQGRFDLLHHEGKVMNIIELKSGKSYRPNAYGLNNSHYHQTLLYDLILESNFGKQTKRNNFILYSAESKNALRYAPTLKSEQREALKVRNRIYLEECKMQHSSAEQPYIYDFLQQYDEKLKGFKGQDHSAIKKVYKNLSPAERRFWETSFSFLSREYALSKIGDELSETSKGLASIWQLDKDQKHQRFLLLNDLKITTDNSQEDDPHLLLKFTPETVQLSNFRVGDIIILYPSEALKNYQLRSQIFKCTLSEIHADHIVLRLRSKQMNSHAFDENKLYNVEHDILDSSFNKTFRQLFHFVAASKDLRAKILGMEPPQNYETLPTSKISIATPLQNKIINRAIAAEDYHLIWGPPGTGKTSVILKNIIAHYYQYTQTRMLIIGYTNRAVDEICQAIENIDKEIDYIRIGSKHSCGAAYKAKLLNTHLEKIRDRKSLKSLLAGQQIYIGTLASIIGKSELFDLLQFGVCIVDEASQILEASLAGILTKTKKFILIGDHLQLPAIVLQNTHQSKIEDIPLNELGFRSYAESLFERLYRRCIDQKWHWAYSQLREQGRMHKDIMKVVNDLSYHGQLELLNGIDRLIADKHGEFDTYKNTLVEQRILYQFTPINDGGSIRKVNDYEARAVAKIISNLLEIYQLKNIPLTSFSIGVITPFRAQIAMIKNILEEKGINYKKITIDTVERYQGGARDIIIMSTVVNSPFQLESIVSKNIDGIDRKLNVALSRAREQFILIGHQETLEFSPHYKYVIEKSHRL